MPYFNSGPGHPVRVYLSGPCSNDYHGLSHNDSLRSVYDWMGPSCGNGVALSCLYAHGRTHPLLKMVVMTSSQWVIW